MSKEEWKNALTLNGIKSTLRISLWVMIVMSVLMLWMVSKIETRVRLLERWKDRATEAARAVKVPPLCVDHSKTTETTRPEEKNDAR